MLLTVSNIFLRGFVHYGFLEWGIGVVPRLHTTDTNCVTFMIAAFKLLSRLQQQFLQWAGVGSRLLAKDSFLPRLTLALSLEFTGHREHSLWRLTV
jgi:hypothetical protein